MGLGLTTTVAVTGVAEQEALDALMVNVTVMGAPVLLVNVPLILPVPLAAIPVTEPVLSLVQLYVAPDRPLLSTILVIDAPVQIPCDAGVAVAAMEPRFSFTQGNWEQKSSVSSL